MIISGNKPDLYKKIIVILIITLAMSGCGSKKEAPPTQNPQQVFTEIAQQVSVGLTQTAAAVAAYMPPTAAPAAAPAAPAEDADPAKQTQIALAEQASQGGPTIAPLPEQPTEAESLIPIDASPIADEQSSADSKCKYRALLGYDSPKDGSWIMTGKNFKRIWLITNVGDCAWPAQTYLRWVSGELFNSGSVEIITNVAVNPGERVRVETDMQAPEIPVGSGKITYEGKWLLATPDGHLFGLGENGKGYFWISLVVCEEKVCKGEDATKESKKKSSDE